MRVLLYLFVTITSACLVDPYYIAVTANIELQVPLTPLMSYDCKTDGHSILIKEISMDGIPLTDGNVIFDYHVPEGVVWKDVKYRTNMGFLFISVPIVYPHFYTVQSINDGALV
jgi:hypothetical protein